MQYMIIETFHEGKVKTLYNRFEKEGRLMPEGLHYINSWIDESITTCYQLMETERFELLEEWISNWSDLADFKIVPVLSSAEAKRKALA